MQITWLEKNTNLLVKMTQLIAANYDCIVVLQVRWSLCDGLAPYSQEHNFQGVKVSKTPDQKHLFIDTRYMVKKKSINCGN